MLYNVAQRFIHESNNNQTTRVPQQTGATNPVEPNQRFSTNRCGDTHPFEKSMDAGALTINNTKTNTTILFAQFSLWFDTEQSCMVIAKMPELDFKAIAAASTNFSSPNDDRSFREHFGEDASVVGAVWKALWEQDLLPPNARPKHLLWLFFWWNTYVTQGCCATFCQCHHTTFVWWRDQMQMAVASLDVVSVWVTSFSLAFTNFFLFCTDQLRRSPRQQQWQPCHGQCGWHGLSGSRDIPIRSLAFVPQAEHSWFAL